MEEEERREKTRDGEIAQFLEDTRLWRVANSAQWVAWGILQAKIPQMTVGGHIDEEEENGKLVTSPPRAPSAGTHPPVAAAEKLAELEADEDDGEFDYLSYAHERAMFFWGDIVRLGIVTEAQLPPDLLSKMKTVDY